MTSIRADYARLSEKKIQKGAEGRMLVYQTRLEHLCDLAVEERDQEKLKQLMDEILQLLSEHLKDSSLAH